MPLELCLAWTGDTNSSVTQALKTQGNLGDQALQCNPLQHKYLLNPLDKNNLWCLYKNIL